MIYASYYARIKWGHGSFKNKHQMNKYNVSLYRAKNWGYQWNNREMDSYMHSDKWTSTIQVLTSKVKQTRYVQQTDHLHYRTTGAFDEDQATMKSRD